VGYGSIGKRHVRNLLSNTKSQIVIYTKRKNLTSLDKKRVKIFDSLSKCILEKPDVGFITNETAYHMQTAIKLAREKLDLFIEKPLSNSMKDVMILKNIVKRNKLIVQMGYNLRFHECVNKIRQLIKQKKIGRIISVQAENGSYLPDWHPSEDYKKGYAGKKQLGGGIILTQIHDVDYLYWIFGNVQEVFSITGKFSELKIDVEDLSSILLRFSNDVIGEIHLDYFQKPPARSCKVVGTHGTVYWDSHKNNILLYDVNNKKWVEKMKLKNYDMNDMYLDEIEHFIKCVKKSEKSINPIDEGAKILNVAIGIKKSSKLKKMVMIN